MDFCHPHHPAHWLIWIVVGGWVLPGVLLRLSPAILALAWAVGEDHWCRTGDNMPVNLYYAIDAASMAALLFIVAWRGMACGDVFCPANRREWSLLAFYPFMIFIYSGDFEIHLKWWGLWALSLSQFALAGGWPAFGKNRTSEARRGFLAMPVRTKGG